MKTEMYPEGMSPELKKLQQEVESMKVKIEKVIVVSTFEEVDNNTLPTSSKHMFLRYFNMEGELLFEKDISVELHKKYLKSQQDFQNEVRGISKN